MANTLKLKRSAASGVVPSVAQLQLGELAINTYDGRLFTKRNNGADSLVEFISSTGGTINGMLTIGGTSVSGNEGGELRLTKAPNSTLAGDLVIDQYAQQLRIVENGSPFRGAVLDLAGCGSPSILIHSSNYNAYAPTLTGTGAVGTWGINITGSAAMVGGIAASSVVHGNGTLSASLAAPTVWSAAHVSQYKSGFWDVNGAAWTPDVGWWWGLTICHTSNSSSYNYGAQIAIPNGAGQNPHVRHVGGGVAGPWHKIWTQGNDGTGSGLDADMVDGKHVGSSGNALPLLDAANTWSNVQTISVGGSQLLLHSAANAPTAIYRNDGTNYYLLFSNAGAAPSGTYNALRPFSVNLTTGLVNLGEGLKLTRAWDGTTGNAALFLDNAAANRIDWRAAGVGAPTTSTRSEGTKAVLYPALGESTVDYAWGYALNTFWTSIPQQSGRCFKQFAGTTPIAALHGDGTPFVYQSTPTTQNATATLTAAQIRTGILTCTPTAAITLTLPTSSNMDNSLWDSETAMDWSVINLATDSSRTVTLSSNNQHSLTGNPVVAANTSARFRTQKTPYEQLGEPVFATYRIS